MPEGKAAAKAEAASSVKLNGGAGHFVKDRGEGETVSTWWGRYLDAAGRGDVGRKNRGMPQLTAEQRRGRCRQHIEPYVGGLSMAKVTK